MNQQERPLRFVFVRHGESEANVVHGKEKKGDFSGYTEEFRSKSDKTFDLTERGIAQAVAAGEWIRKNINGGVLDIYYVSTFTRALQTAGHLSLPIPEFQETWRRRDYMREQDWGYFSDLTRDERNKVMSALLGRPYQENIHHPPLGGEAMSETLFRAKIGIIETMYRELMGGKAGIAVAHGRLMWAIRMIMEGFDLEEYEELDSRKHPEEKINNCQVIEYTREEPGNPRHRTESFSWFRSVCPWDLSRSSGEWREIQRKRYTNEELRNWGKTPKKINPMLK